MTFFIKGGFKIAMRRGLGAAVFIGIMGLGEVAYSKYQLKKKIEFNNLRNYYQEQRELIQLKKQHPCKSTKPKLTTPPLSFKPNHPP